MKSIIEAGEISLSASALLFRAIVTGGAARANTFKFDRPPGRSRQWVQVETP
jgi:hypothetical protein